jgi:hypothetical protein
MGAEYQAVRESVDSAIDGTPEAIQAARHLTGLAQARTDAADLVAYSRLANEAHAGRALLQSVELARTQGHLLTVALSLTARANWAAGNGVTFRLARRRDFDNEHRTQLPRLLADLVTWQDARDEDGAAYRDRLEFLLAMHPDLTVAPGTSAQRTVGGDIAFRAGLPGAIVKNGVVAGPLVTVQASAERTVDVRREASGQLRMPDDQASVAAQRVRGTAGLAVGGSSLPLWHDGSSTANSENFVMVGPPPVSATVTQELWQRMDRKRLDVMVAGQKMDAEYDRHTMSAEELLAETQVNRLEWIRRAMESRSDVPAELQNTLGYELADADLARFDRIIREVSKTTSYAGFIIRYGPRPVARVLADVFGSLVKLSVARAELDQAERWNEARNDVLRTELNWRPRTILARERGAQTRSRGLALLLRTQTHDQVEVQRTIAQYPPDSGVGHRTGISDAGALPEGPGWEAGDRMLPENWGVIKGTALPPDDWDRRRRHIRMSSVRSR